MRRVHVVSSVLTSVGYERERLTVEFVSGSVYVYLDVPEEVYDALLAAPSHGAFFNEHVRDTYGYVRLT